MNYNSNCIAVPKPPQGTLTKEEVITNLSNQGHIVIAVVTSGDTFKEVQENTPPEIELLYIAITYIPLTSFIS